MTTDSLLPLPSESGASSGIPDPAAPPLRPLALGGSCGVLLAILFVLFAPDVREAALWLVSPAPPSYTVETDPEQALRALEQRTRTLKARLDALAPDGPYLVVSTTENRFRLMNRDRLSREGLCSTGSYTQLRGADDRTWLFTTPRGLFRIQRKTEKPVWTKPDWAFIEEGLPVPPPGSPERIERGVLGDYSLALGDGYLIHGTLYQRLLGMPVTHGCVRLGDDDLAAVYQALRIGSPVFIY